MFIYTIKKDGYVLGQAKGINKAIEIINKHLEFMGCAHLRKWIKKSREPICIVKNGGIEEYYTIERN